MPAAMPPRRRQAHDRCIVRAVAALVTLLLLVACSPAAGAATPLQMVFEKYCQKGSPLCQVAIPFYPPFTGDTSSSCYWTRTEVDFPKYTAWTLDQSMISLRSPGNTSCTVASVSLSGHDVFELKAPTLDCFRADGCLCTSITPSASRAIRWQPVPSLLRSTVTRRVCRAARTYVYVRLSCRLTLRDTTTDQPGWRQDPTTGEYEPPATVTLSWRRSINDTDPLAPALRSLDPTTLLAKDVRAYCRRQATVSSPALFNRLFLSLLVAISFILALGSLFVALLRCLFGLVTRRGATASAAAAAGGLPTAAPAQDKNIAAAAASSAGQGAAAMPAASAPSRRPPTLVMELLRVDFHEGRDRAFTSLLVAAVGLYVAGTLFEPAIQPQSAYERALIPSLRSATMTITTGVSLGSYQAFGRRFGRLILTICLCSTLGALVFGALLYNMSSRPWAPTRRAAWVYRGKLLISILCMFVLDIAMLLYIVSNYSMAHRWTQPVAYHFISIVTLLVYLTAHVLFIRLMFRRPQPLRSRRLSDIRKDLHLAKALQQFHTAASAPPPPSTRDTNPLIDPAHPPSAPSTPIHPTPGHASTPGYPPTPAYPTPDYSSPGLPTPGADPATPIAPPIGPPPAIPAAAPTPLNLPYSFTAHLQAALPPSNPIHDPAAAVLADLTHAPTDPENGLPTTTTTGSKPETSAPSLAQRLKSLVLPPPGAPGLGERLRDRVAHVRSLLREEGNAFRFSSWFIAPLIISLVLLVFFFLRSLYVIDSIRDCLGPSGCPSWTGLNSAIVPLITTLFNALLYRQSPDFLSVLASARTQTPAQNLLLSMTSNFSAREFATRTVKDNAAGLTIPDTIVTYTLYGVLRDMSTKPPTVSVYNGKTRTKTPDYPVTARPVVVEGFRFYTKGSDFMVNNQTWEDFYMDSYTFEEDLPGLYSCNKTTTANYIADLGDESYREYPYRDQLDQLATALGVTGPELAQQLIITTARPVLVEMCNTTDVLPNTTTGNAGVQAILDTIAKDTFQPEKGTERAATDTAGSSDTITRALQQRDKLRAQSNRTLKFYKDLKKAFGAGAYLGAVVALGVSLVSLLVIVGVYKKAVLRLRRQMAISAVFAEHPEGQKLLQGTTMAQKKLIMEAYGLDTATDGSSSSSAAVTLRMFTMLEMLNSQRMTLAIFFFGIVFSTVLLQLIVCTSIFGLLLTALLHPAFWSHAFPIVASWVLALAISQIIVLVVISGTIGARIAPNDTIVNMSSWLAYFIVFSFAYIVLGVLLAGVRLVLILLSAVVMSCRIDLCLNTLSKVLDPAYSAFLSMMKMQVEMKRYSDEELVGPALDEGHRNALLEVAY